MCQLCDLSFGNCTNQNVIMEYMFADNDIIMAAKVLAYMFNLEELVHKEPFILHTRTYLFSDTSIIFECDTISTGFTKIK